MAQWSVNETEDKNEEQIHIHTELDYISDIYNIHIATMSYGLQCRSGSKTGMARDTD